MSPLAAFGSFVICCLAGARSRTFGRGACQKAGSGSTGGRIGRTALAAQLGGPRVRPPPPLGHGDAGSESATPPPHTPRQGLLGARGAEPSPPWLLSLQPCLARLAPGDAADAALTLGSHGWDALLSLPGFSLSPHSPTPPLRPSFPTLFLSCLHPSDWLLHTTWRGTG